MQEADVEEGGHADILRPMGPVSTVLLANALWLGICTVWCLLMISQAAADRRAGVGFQKPVGPDEID
jgi:hypothetical protein